jgi:hypothetical protein
MAWFYGVNWVWKRRREEGELQAGDDKIYKIVHRRGYVFVNMVAELRQESGETGTLLACFR